MAVNPLGGSYDDAHGKHGHPRPPLRARLARIAHLVPWAVFLAAGAFIAGLVFWTAGLVRTRDATVRLAEALGVDASLRGSLVSTSNIVVIAVTVSSSIVVALVVILSIVRGWEHGMLLNAAARDKDGPEPWLYRGYQIFAHVLNALVWLLLLACVALLAAQLIWWGGFRAVSGAMEWGVTQADLQLSPGGATLSAASQMTAVVTAALRAGSGGALAPLLGGAPGLPFTPVCAPVCLNAGSFAFFLRMADSCVCGSAAIDGARAAARAGAAHAGVALAGAAAMWLAACLSLVLLAGQAVAAGFDRRSAAWLQEQRAAAYAEGCAASEKDCVRVSAGGGGFGDDAVAVVADDQAARV